MVIRSSIILPLLAAAMACKPTGSLPDEASATVMEATSDDSGDPTTTTTTGDDPNETDPDTTTDDATTDDTTTTGTTEAPVPVCGDGHVDVEMGEECDDGPGNDNEGECTELCRLAECGDGYIQRGEECDLGGENDNEGECTNLCTVAACGDGFLQEGEACDLGEDNDADKNGGCHPETCEIVMTCGDGVLQEHEECDASAQEGIAKACNDQCYFDSRLVFATSEVYAGDFMGITKADGKCKALAAAAEFENPTKFVAWISLPGDSIASRIDHLPFRYVRPDGVIVAHGWEELTKGKLKAPIELDEWGMVASGTSAFAWTSTLSNGEAAPGDPCLGWTTVLLGKMGGVGAVSATDDDWTNSMAIPCSAKAHLYCIET